MTWGIEPLSLLIAVLPLPESPVPTSVYTSKYDVRIGSSINTVAFALKQNRSLHYAIAKDKSVRSLHRCKGIGVSHIPEFFIAIMVACVRCML